MKEREGDVEEFVDSNEMSFSALLVINKAGVFFGLLWENYVQVPKLFFTLVVVLLVFFL